MDMNIKNHGKEMSYQDFIGKVFADIYFSEDRATVKFISDSGERFTMGAVGPHPYTYIENITGDIRKLIGTRILNTSVFVYQSPMEFGLFSRAITYGFTTAAGVVGIQWTGVVEAMSSPLVSILSEDSEDAPLLATIPVRPQSLMSNTDKEGKI